MPTHPAKHNRRWPIRLRRLAVEAAIVIAVVSAFHWYRARPLVEGPAPALAAPAVADGAWIDLDSPASGPRLVYFWATWCPVCKLEQGSIEAISQDHDVITVAMQSGQAPEIASYLDEHRLGLRTIADPNGEIAQRWGVTAVPVSFIIDADGVIRHRAVGYTTGIGLRLRLWLANRRI
jgi:thiol-disulfide isomerase/thioredoxin